MRNSIFVTGFFVLFSRINLSRGLCPAGCFCDEKDLSARCEASSDLHVIPITLNPDIVELNITGTQLNRLDAAFQFYGRLQRLDLSFNRISVLEKLCFEHQNDLKRLDLSRNRLEDLESPKVFFPLPDLEFLSLEGNRLRSLKPGIFSHLKTLRTLVLKSNFLESLSPETFGGISGTLRELDLSSNRLKALDLRDLYGLDALDVSSNPLESFSELPQNLRELFLRNSSLEDGSAINSALHFLKDLRTLDISFNPLSKPKDFHLVSDSLSKLVLVCNSGLIEFSLRYSLSKLSRLRTLVIKNQTELRSVEVDFEAFERLRTLDISDNPKLVSVEFLYGNDDFSESQRRSKYLGRITEIFLRNNALFYLEPGFLSESDSLERLSLEGNPLICDCRLIWIKNFYLKDPKRDLLVKCSSGFTNLTTIPDKDLYCRNIEFDLWVAVSVILTAGSFVTISILVLWTRKNRLSKKKKIVDAATVVSAEDGGTIIGTWRSKSTGMTFLDQNEFIYATPNATDRIIQASQAPRDPSEYYYGRGVLPNRYFIQQIHPEFSNMEEDEIFYLP